MSRSLLPKIAVVGILAAGAGLGWYLYTSGPVPTLAAQAPADTAVWVEIPKFKQTLGAFRKSTAYEDFKKSELFQEFNKGWGKLIKELEEDEHWKKTKLAANEDTLMNFLGQNAAYGVIAPKTGKPSVYFMSKIDVLGLIKEGIESGQWRELVDRLQGAAKGKDGKVESYEGVEIITRTKEDKYSKKTWSISFSLVGSAIVVSDNIETVKKVIDVDKGKKPSLAVEPGFAEEFKKLPRDKVAMAWMDTGMIRDKERFKNTMLQSVEMLGGERELKQFKKMFTGNELDILVNDLKDFRGIAGALHMPEGDLYSMQFASSRQGADTFKVFDKKTNISDRVTDDTLFFLEMKDVYKTIEGFIKSDTFKKMRETKLGKKLLSLVENPAEMASMTGEELPRDFKGFGRFEMKMSLALLSVAAREVLSNDVSMTLDIVEAKRPQDAFRPIVYVRTRPALRILTDVAAGIFAEHSKESGVKNYDHNNTKVFEFNEEGIDFYLGRVNGDILFTTDKGTIEGLIDGKGAPGASKDLAAALAKTPKDAQFSMYFNSKVYSKVFNMFIAEIPERDREEVKSILKLSSGLPEYAAIAAKVSPDYKDYEIYSYQKLPDPMAKSVATSFPSANPHPDVWTRLPKDSFAALSLEMEPAKAFDSLTRLLMPIIVPNLIEARKQGNEASAIGSMRALNSSQAIYLERSKSQQYGTLKQLAADRIIDEVLATGLKQGYRFVVTVDPKNPQYEYWITASPSNPSMGERHFYTDQSGVIRYSMSPITRQNMKQSYAIGGGGPGANSFAPKIAKKLDEKEIQRLIDAAIADFNKEFLFGFRLKEDLLANLGKSHGFSIITQEKLVPNGLSVSDQERMIAVPAGILALQVTQTKIYEDLFEKLNAEIRREMGTPTRGIDPVENQAMSMLRNLVSNQSPVKRNDKDKTNINLLFLKNLENRVNAHNNDKNRRYKLEIRATTKAPHLVYLIKASPKDGYGFHFAINESGEVRIVQENFNWDRKVFNNSPRPFSRLPRGFVVKRRDSEKKNLLGFVKTGNYYRMSFPKRDEREIKQMVGKGFRPCYTFHNGYLILTTSEGAMKKALASKKGDCLTESTSFNRLMKGQPRGVNSSFFFSMDGVMKQIKANSKMIALQAYPVPAEVTATKKNDSNANKASAIGSLRTINASQAIFIERDQTQKYGTLKALMASGYIDNVLGSGEKQGYKFIVQPGANPEYQYWAAADPIAKGGKYLYTNQAGVIYESDSPIRPLNKKSCSPSRNARPTMSGSSNYWEQQAAKRKKEREWRKENLDANNKELKEILDSASFLGGFVSTSTLKGNDVESRFLYRLTMD